MIRRIKILEHVEDEQSLMIDAVDCSSFTATNSCPGSEEKIRVMEQRYSMNLPLFHPGDKRDQSPEFEVAITDEEDDDEND